MTETSHSREDDVEKIEVNPSQVGVDVDVDGGM